MAINKFQRSRLTFQPQSLILESHQHIKTAFSETTWSIELIKKNSSHISFNDIGDVGPTRFAQMMNQGKP